MSDIKTVEEIVREPFDVQHFKHYPSVPVASEAIDRLSNYELLAYISDAIEQRLAAERTASSAEGGPDA